MTISLDDLSPAALETLAGLIEQRLDDKDAYLEPVTWYQAQARQNAARELSQALRGSALVWVPAQHGLASNESLALH
jgi:hypothetical protein